jgi:hypothetical protein
MLNGRRDRQAKIGPAIHECADNVDVDDESKAIAKAIQEIPTR